MKLGRYVIDMDRPVFSGSDRPVFAGNDRHVFDLGQIDTDMYRAGFDDSRTKALYEWLRRKGLRVSEVPQDYLFREFGGERDPVGYRTGNEIYVAGNHRKRILTDTERRSIAYHEFGAGYDHASSDEEAHEAGTKAALSLGDTEAFEELRLQLANAKARGIF